MVRKLWVVIAALGVLGASGAHAEAWNPDPKADFKAFRAYFTSKFPQVKLDDFVNGPYSMNEDMRKQWEEKEQFPPYDFAVDKGKELFEAKFKNGKSFDGTSVRDAIEKIHGFQGTTGVYDFSADNHQGITKDPFVIAQIIDGKVRIAQ